MVWKIVPHESLINRNNRLKKKEFRLKNTDNITAADKITHVLL